jgi:hypothetical protein
VVSFWGALSRSLFLLDNLNRLGLNIVPAERIMAVPPGFPNILNFFVAGGSLMKVPLCLWLAFLSLSSALAAKSVASQTPAASTTPQPAPVQAQSTQTDFTSKKGFVLEDETPVRLRLNRTISSADAHVGDTVDFETLDDITVNGTLVIPKGGLAFATVTEAQAKRRMARGGKLDINIDYVKLVSGDKAALRAVKDVKGGGHTWGHGGRNGGHQPCLLSRGTVFPVYARQGHQHSEGD